MAFITLTGISKSFAGVRALQNVDMVINKGEIRCLAGENGGGKSTLIKVISGFYTPDEGQIEINGKLYKKLTPQQAIKEGIQIIYQDFSVFPNLTVAENIALNHERLLGKWLVNWKSIRENAQRALDMIGVQMDLDALVGSLSVADKQLVAICRALLQDAKLLVMDEPTTALTRKEVDALFAVTRDLQAKGISILFVSHKLEEVFEIAEELTILRNGAKVIEGPMKEFDRAKFIYHMTGRTIEPTQFESPVTSGEPLMKVENIGITDLFDDISFELYAGEVMAITGLLGSGRSELARALFGLDKLTSGRIFIEGKQITLGNVKDAIESGIAYVPEDRLTEGLFLPHSIDNNVISATIDGVLNKQRMLSAKKTKTLSSSWIEELKIVTPSGNMPAQTLSGGNQQRVVLAKWLSSHPKILILNGPTVGVDIGSKTDIHSYTRELAKKGMGVIIISDDIPEVLENCNRVLLMKKGQIIEKMSCEGLTEEALSRKLTDVVEEVAR
ncbi:MAG: sugar ABC transporter ATP-binding protein [Oscillospiraceae bacterium]|nr:sugar ABC transporter ATP-binding protein [Oscillospiraceae bacterium]